MLVNRQFVLHEIIPYKRVCYKTCLAVHFRLCFSAMVMDQVCYSRICNNRVFYSNGVCYRSRVCHSNAQFVISMFDCTFLFIFCSIEWTLAIDPVIFVCLIASQLSSVLHVMLLTLDRYSHYQTFDETRSKLLNVITDNIVIQSM